MRICLFIILCIFRSWKSSLLWSASDGRNDGKADKKDDEGTDASDWICRDSTWMSVRWDGILFPDSCCCKNHLESKSGYVGADMVRFHPAVLLATILLVGVTIFLASQKPIKMAVDISPIEALGYCPTHKNVKVKKSRKGESNSKTFHGAVYKG